VAEKPCVVLGDFWAADNHAEVGICFFESFGNGQRTLDIPNETGKSDQIGLTFGNRPDQGGIARAIDQLWGKDLNFGLRPE